VGKAAAQVKMTEKKMITPAGYQRYADELHRLWHEDRPRVVQEVADAAAQGDRSENAEYIYGKKKLREIDRRIRELSNLLDRLVVVDPKTVDSKQVKFGARVDCVDQDGQNRSYQIVGEDEVEGGAGRISGKSPIGRALLGKEVGDSVVVVRPAGELELEITKIRYE
jgi:transcription elongation factor GreB